MQPRSATVEEMAGIFTKHIWQPYPQQNLRYPNQSKHRFKTKFHDEQVLGQQVKRSHSYP